jgi:hypothetical protein
MLYLLHSEDTDRGISFSECFEDFLCREQGMIKRGAHMGAFFLAKFSGKKNETGQSKNSLPCR